MDIKKENRAKEYLKMFEPRDPSTPYYLAYSGGKDSDAILCLAELAGVRYEAVHNLTTVDAPETVNYVRSKNNVRIDRPDKTMWQLIVEKRIPPTRAVRYCCSYLKERGGRCRKVVTGVRKDESYKRSQNSSVVKIWDKPKTAMKAAEDLGVEYSLTKEGGLILNNDNDESREFVEHCYQQHKVTINPIVDWTEADVWEFLHHYGIEGNPLYQCGFHRIGCTGCPLASRHRYFEFARYPKYKDNYIRAFDRMLKARERDGLPVTNWANGVDVFKWWMEEDPAQISMFDDEYNAILEEIT